MNYHRHWSFVVTDPKYLFPLSLIFLVIGLYLAFSKKDATYFQRFGNFIIAIGVWMSMRYIFREGINTFKDALDASPTLPGKPGDKAFLMNPRYFNNITYGIGDAWLTIKGFVLVVIGSMISSFGDLILKSLFPSRFAQNKLKFKKRKSK